MTDTVTEYDAALAALAWQVDLGVDEAIGDAPCNRYDAVAPPLPAAPVAGTGDRPAELRLSARHSAAPPPAADAEAVQAAAALAGGAGSLGALRQALAAYEHCELKRGARSLVFADGNPAARVMIVGEAPGRDEDAEGRPFVGRAGQLLDRMFAAIGLSRDATESARSIYITNVMVWRPPQNREPTASEIAMMVPFLERHVALADPAVIVTMGNIPLAALLGTRGITRLRGQWATAFGRPVLPMFHPAYLLRNPEAKREAWADLLELQARLREVA